MNFYSKNFKVLSKCIKVKSEKSKTLQPPLPSKNPEIKPTQSHLLVISFHENLAYIPMLPTQMQWIKGQESPPCKYFWGVLVANLEFWGLQFRIFFWKIFLIGITWTYLWWPGSNSIWPWHFWNSTQVIIQNFLHSPSVSNKQTLLQLFSQSLVTQWGVNGYLATVTFSDLVT